MNITPESKVGEIAAHHPLATRVFARHGIDFCCGGGVALQDLCEKRGLETAQLLEEIEETLAEPDPAGERWDEASNADLVRHIVDTYHLSLREELPRLEAMARKVVRVHGDKDPERLPELLRTLLELKSELEVHMDREETVLFPEILSHGENAHTPIAPFTDDHEEVGRAVAHLRELTDGFQVPEHACNTWRALWHGLAALEGSIHEHVHLENNILFPRVNAA